MADIHAGPWIVCEDDAWFDVPYIPIESGKAGTPTCKIICEVRGNGNAEDSDVGIGEQDRAVAQAIAALPDLLAAARAVLFQFTQGDQVFGRDACVSQLREAYLKAKGTA